MMDVEYSNMLDFYENIEEYNPVRKLKVLIVFDNMIPDMLSNEKLQQIVTDLLVRGKKVNISFTRNY